MVKQENEDIIVPLFHRITCESSQGFHALVVKGNKKWVVVVHPGSQPEKIVIKVTGLSEPSPYKGFKFISILDEDHTILTLNQTSEKSSKGITAIMRQTDLVQREGLLVFKILLTASSTDKVPKPSTTYSRTDSAIHVLPVMVPTGLVGGPHVSPAPPGVVSQALDISQPTVDIDTIDIRDEATVLPDGDGQERGDVFNDNHKPGHQVLANVASPPTQIESCDLASRLPCSEDSSILTNTLVCMPLSNTTIQEVSHDVHFYHYDLAKGVSNILKSHRVSFQKYSTLALYVDKSQAAKVEFVSKQKPTVSSSYRTPVVVDISCFSYAAFKALIGYLYTQDIEDVLSMISVASPVSYPPSADVSCAGATTKAIYHGLSLHLDELLYVAHAFDIRELVDVCVQRLIAELTVDNALHISSIFGEQFQEIKQAATIYTSQYQDQILKECNTSSDLNENYKHPQFIEGRPLHCF